VTVRRAFAVAGWAAATLSPALAVACPYCMGSAPALPTSLKAVGIFLLLPFVVFGAVATVARRLR
jgi:membrane protein DedA with SNARE-associated domain